MFEAKDAYYRWLPNDLAEVPVPEVTSDVAAQLERLVDAASSGFDRQPTEQQINEAAFELYGFDLESRQLVEEWHGLRLRAETASSIRSQQTNNDD